MITKAWRYILTGTMLIAVFMLMSCTQQKNQSEIVIGAVAPTTGKYGEMGNDLLNAVRMAVEERNAQGGIDGKQIRLVIEDDKGSAKDAVTVAQKLIGDKAILGIVGHMNSDTTLAASPVYSQAGVPLVMPVPTNPKITKQKFSNLFRIPITDDKQGPACITFITEQLKGKKIAIIHNKEAYGSGIAEEAKKALEAKGLQAVFFEAVSADDKDFRPVITRLKGLTPDAVFFGGGYAEAALFIKQSHDQGLKVPFVMGDGCFDSQLMKIAGAAAEGCYVSNIAPTTAPTPKAQEFYQKFIAKNGKIVAFAPLGYVSANILLDAIAKSPEKSRQGVLKVLQAPSYKYDSIFGEFSFEANGDSRGQRVFMHKISGGQFVTM